MRSVFHRAEKVIDIAKKMAGDNWKIKNRLENIQFYSEFVEPGYTATGPILLGNWNPLEWDKKDTDLIHRVGEILEKIGCDLHWEDEWSSCHSCGGLVRTSPDSYGWTQSYDIVNDCELLCHRCLKDDAAGYLESLEDNPKKALTFGEFNPDDYGYVKVNNDSYENGWYGTVDDPKVIAKDLRSKDIRRFIFTIDGAGQFAINFSVWVHKSEASKLETANV